MRSALLTFLLAFTTTNVLADIQSEQTLELAQTGVVAMDASGEPQTTFVDENGNLKMVPDNTASPGGRTPLSGAVPTRPGVSPGKQRTPSVASPDPSHLPTGNPVPLSEEQTLPRPNGEQPVLPQGSAEVPNRSSSTMEGSQPGMLTPNSQSMPQPNPPGMSQPSSATISPPSSSGITP